jgi:hypothetical protein
MVHVASSMNGGTFEVSWGAMQGGLTSMKYVKVVTCEQGWLYAQPLDETGKKSGDMLWLAPGAVMALWPWTPAAPKRWRTRKGIGI